MLRSKYRFSLDIKWTQSQVSIPVLLNDTLWGFYISLIDDGKPYLLPDGCRAVFVAKKPDGNSLFNDCIIEKNNIIRYDFTANTTNVEGITPCEIRVYGPNGRMLTCPRFTMVVDSRVLLDDEIVFSESEHTTIDSIIASEYARQQAELEREAVTKRAEAAAIAAEEAAERAENAGSGGGGGTSAELEEAIDRAETAANRAEEAAERAENAGSGGGGGTSAELEEAIDRAETAANRAEEAAERAENAGSGGGGSLVEIDTTLTVEGKAADAKATGDRLKVIEEELYYEPIKFTSFTRTPAIDEVEYGDSYGDSVGLVEVKWTLSKTPKTLKFNKKSYDVNLTSLFSQGPFYDTTSWSVEVTDEKNSKATNSTTIYFRYRVWYGVAAEPSKYNQDFIKSLANGEFATSRAKTFTVTAGEGEYIYYCVPVSPSDFGECSFTVNGFTGGFSKVATVAYVNGRSSTNYYIYRSNNDGLGAKTVIVS